MLIHDFLQTFDPSNVVDMVYHGLLHVPEEIKVQQVSWPIGCALDLEVRRTLLLSVERLAVYHGLLQKMTPLIVETEALVCITPKREDFNHLQPE